MSYGTVVKFSTGEALGPATLEDWLESAIAGLSDGRKGIFMRADGYAVRVSGGPDSYVRHSDIIVLRDRAVKRGDTTQGLLYNSALSGNEEAFRTVARAILTTRAETHET